MTIIKYKFYFLKIGHDRCLQTQPPGFSPSGRLVCFQIRFESKPDVRGPHLKRQSMKTDPCYTQHTYRQVSANLQYPGDVMSATKDRARSKQQLRFTFIPFSKGMKVI